MGARGRGLALVAGLLLLPLAACGDEAPAREEGSAARTAAEASGGAASEGSGERASGADGTPSAGRSDPEAPVGSATGRNRAMGTGEAVEPRPFTLEQRFLHAVREGERAEVERALELGASVEARDALGRSALLLAARDVASLPLVRFLHERGAAVDVVDEGGRSAASWAAGRGHAEILRWLLERGAAPDRADEQGRTPLFHAVGGRHPAVVRELLERGAEPNVQDQFGDSPLMLACAKAHGEIAAILLEHGADPSLRDQEGRTARERAAEGSGPCRALEAEGA